MRYCFFVLMILSFSGVAQENILTPLALFDDDPMLTGINEVMIDSEQRFIFTRNGSNTLSTLMIDPGDFSLSVADSLPLTDCAFASNVTLSASGEFAYYSCRDSNGDIQQLGVVAIDVSTGALALLNNGFIVSADEEEIIDYALSPDDQNIYVTGFELNGDVNFTRTYQIDQQAVSAVLIQSIFGAFTEIFISPDGQNVYGVVDAFFSGATTVFSRNTDGTINNPSPTQDTFFFRNPLFTDDAQRVYTTLAVVGEPITFSLLVFFSRDNNGVLITEQADIDFNLQVDNDASSLVIGNNGRLLLVADRTIRAYRLDAESGQYTLIGTNLNNGFAPVTSSDGFFDLLMLPDENLLYGVYSGGIALFQVNDILALDAVAVPALNRQALWLVFTLLLLLGWFAGSRRSRL